MIDDGSVVGLVAEKWDGNKRDSKVGGLVQGVESDVGDERAGLGVV